ALGDYRRAVEYARADRAALTGDRIRQHFGLAGYPAVYSRTYEMWCLAELGEFTDGLALGQEALRIAEELEHPFSLVAPHFTLGHLHAERGEWQRAVAVLEPGLRLCERWDLEAQYMLVASELGYVRALAGQVDKGVALLEQAVAHGAAIQTSF